MKEKIIRILLSVLIAFGLWFYVVTVVSPESEETFYNIQVEPVHGSEQALQDRGWMITSGELPSITVRLRGNRTDLNNLKKSDITAEVDLTKVNAAAGEHPLDIKVNFTGSFELVSQSMSTVMVEVAEWTTKKVPVELIYPGILDQNYIDYRDQVGLDREFIELAGPKEVLDQITQAVVKVDLTGRKNSITNESFTYTLCNDKGEPVDDADVDVDAEAVTVNLKIQRVKEIQLMLNVIYGGGATKENTTIVLDQQTIKVSASDAILDAMGDTLTLGTVKLADIMEDTTLSYTLESLLPKGVDNLSGVPEVSAQITFNGLTTKTLTVTQIMVENLPDGLQYLLDTRQLIIVVRGPEVLVYSITAGDIAVTVDLAGGTLGTDRYEAKFAVDEEYGSVGVLGSHMVTVTLSQEAGGND